MADDPWAAFPVVQPAGAPAADSAPAPAAAAAPAGGGADPWAAFPVVQAAGSPAPTSDAPASTSHDKGMVAAAVASALNPPIVGPAIMGGLQRLSAFQRSMDNGTGYSDELAKVQRSDTATADAHPVATLAGNVAGSALFMAPAVAAAPAAFGLGEGALLSRAAAGAATGAGIGGADAAARGQDVGTGALVGGSVGGLAPAAGAALGSAYRGVTGLMQSAPAELQGTGRIAQSWLKDGVAGLSPEDYAAAKDDVGPAGMFMEMSPKLSDYAGSVADNNSAGKAVVRDALDARFAGRDGRVNDMVDRNLGPAQSPIQFKDALDDQAVPLAQAQAEAVRNSGPVDVSAAFNRLQGALPDAAPGSPEHGAYSQAVTMLGERPQVAPPSSWELDPVGSGHAPEAPPDLPEPPTFGDQAAPSRPGPVGVPRPQDLHSFVRSLGGIQDRGGDLASMGYQNLAARPGQGLGADAMRQAAAQMGYLGPDIDHATANTSVNDLLDALGSDNPIHSVYDQDAAAQWAARDAAMADYQQRGGNSSYPTARPAGMPPRAPGLPSTEPGFDPAQPTGLMPTQSAARILSARKALDDKIDWRGPTTEAPSSALRSQQGAYQQVRRGLSDALHDQVPGYSEPTEALAGINRQRDAMNDGLADLQSNKDPARYPDDFAQTWAALSPEEQAARRLGQRFDIAASLGNRENDFQATRQILQGEGGWNRQNLGTSFGQEPVENVARGLQQEVAMAANRQKIAGGSPTGEKFQRSRLTQPGGQSEGLLGAAKDWWNDLYIDKPSTYLPLNQIGGRVMAGAYERARNEIAPHLVKSGPEADELFQALLAQRQRQAALAPANTDELTKALMLMGQVGRQNAMGQ